MSYSVADRERQTPCSLSLPRLFFGADDVPADDDGDRQPMSR